MPPPPISFPMSKIRFIYLCLSHLIHQPSMFNISISVRVLPSTLNFSLHKLVLELSPYGFCLCLGIKLCFKLCIKSC